MRPPSGGRPVSRRFGRRSDPLPIAPLGKVGFSPGGENVAFYFGDPQKERLTARDDLRRYMANLCTAVYTPITPPKWGHIPQVSYRIPPDKIRTGQSAYKKLLLDQEQVDLTVVSRRNLRRVVFLCAAGPPAWIYRGRITLQMFRAHYCSIS